MWQEKLVFLLISMFSADELRRLLRWRYPKIEPNLPGTLSSPAALATAAVTALDESRAIDDEFFRMLREERPRRTTEIDGIVRLWRESLSGRSASQPAAPPAAPAATTASAETPAPTSAATTFRYDVFIAHAGSDSATAGRLYDELVVARSNLRLFLDTRSLLLGDAWDQVIPRALQQSMVIVIMVSERIDAAWYAREEIAMSIELARQNGGRQRVVPLFLDGRPSATPGGSSIPYGLRIVQGLSMPETTLTEAAQQLAQLVERMRA